MEQGVAFSGEALGPNEIMRYGAEDLWLGTAVIRPTVRVHPAITVIRSPWSGGQQSHDGAWFTVGNARIYTRPKTDPRKHSEAIDRYRDGGYDDPRAQAAIARSRAS